MKLIDRYIIRQFLTTTLFSLLGVLVVFIVIDAMENLDDFIDRNASVQIILTYYLYFMPEIIKLIMPVALLLASLFVTARMSTQNELTAMKAGGMSLYRIVIPYLVVAFIISIASVYFNGWIVPKANKHKFTLERVYLLKNTVSGSGANIYIQDSPTRILSIGYYDEYRSTASRVSIQDFNDTNRTMLVGRIDAQTMEWDSTGHRWMMRSGVRRWFADDKEHYEAFEIHFLEKIHFDPEDLRKKQEQPDEMEYRALEKFIDNQRRAGQDVSRWLVDYHSKISFPFASVIVVLFGVPFASVKRRGGIGVQLGISLLICFIYLIFMKVSQVFGYNGDVNPLLTAWMANLLFLVGAAFIIIRVQK
ncbi:MAG: LPS export ABC transporter permease LptG [Bacteroidetes bacterium]|nr:LPS export ABC transporter permease LptG [Bacteroidota bacterium]MCW5894202.1 LPS export ABC transporter permease LptG [Bacteroidota bacterium]